MQYRNMGRTEKQVGVLGLGCEHLDGKPYKQVEDTVRTALDYGVNYMDVFMPGREVRSNIAKALGDDRKSTYIQAAIGSTDINQQYDISRDLPTVQRYFEEALRIFGGYIDVGFIFLVDTDEELRRVMDGGTADYAQRLKQNGDIRHIGFSSHKPEVARKMVETGIFEMMMFSINLAFDLSPAGSSGLDAMGKNWQDEKLETGLNPERTALYALCEQMGVGISVMKTLGAGKLISKEHTPFSIPMTLNQCIHYALSRPAVYSVLLGCQSGTEVKEMVKYLDADMDEKDYSAFLSEAAADFLGKCVYCNHCLPCPAEIDIALVNKFLDIAKLDENNISPSVLTHYRRLDNGADACILCGSCEKRCPFGVQVMENMRIAAKLFSI